MKIIGYWKCQNQIKIFESTKKKTNKLKSLMTEIGFKAYINKDRTLALKFDLHRGKQKTKIEKNGQA